MCLSCWNDFLKINEDYHWNRHIILMIQYNRFAINYKTTRINKQRLKHKARSKKKKKKKKNRNNYE